jgi:organic hydroperoxide reductase OsmC/OhrA
MERENLVFPVGLEWPGDGKRVRLFVDGKEPLDVATPPEFEGGIPGVWSPEDLFVGAAASCFAVTFVGIAAKSRVPLYGLSVDGVGVVGRREDGRTAFLEVELHVAIDTDEEYVANARKAADRAERHCLVAVSLAIPVRIYTTVNARQTVA